LLEWNKEHNSTISILSNWPPNSPDLNLIENVWAEVQRQVNEVRCYGLEDFKVVVTSTFKNLKKETINNLFSSMKKRIDSCIELPGDETKY
jgi:transposase